MTEREGELELTLEIEYLGSELEGDVVLHKWRGRRSDLPRPVYCVQVREKSVLHAAEQVLRYGREGWRR